MYKTTANRIRVLEQRYSPPKELPALIPKIVGFDGNTKISFNGVHYEFPDELTSDTWIDQNIPKAKQAFVFRIVIVNSPANTSN
jgi:hypothetical protein